MMNEKSIKVRSKRNLSSLMEENKNTILLLKKQGASTFAISKILGVNSVSLAAWLEKWDKEKNQEHAEKISHYSKSFDNIIKHSISMAYKYLFKVYKVEGSHSWLVNSSDVVTFERKSLILEILNKKIEANKKLQWYKFEESKTNNPYSFLITINVK